MLAFPVLISHAGDSTGASLGTIADITAKTAGQPTAEEIAIQVGHNKISINFVWTLVTGFLVMFMQAGFAMVETGFTRAKNAAHTMSMNFMVYPLGMIGFWICGFAFMFGGVGPLATLGSENILNHAISITLFGKSMSILGWKGFFLSGDSYSAGIYTMFLFQMVFMDTTATIPTGSMAERWRFLPFVIYGLLVGTVLYPVYGCWVWGGGWLATLGSNFGLGHGHVDFAGSSVVHLTGGVIALVGAKLIGPRVGKFNADGTPNAIPGHHIPMAVVGTFILCFGWFGFNPGSTLAGTDLRIGVVATNTMLAGAAGAMTSMIYMWKRFGKPDISMMCNGMLAGLVAITAPCAFVNSISAVIIGGIAGVLVILAVFFVERTLKIDDPVGAIAVHGVNGAWGVLSLGLFADGTYGDGWNGVPGAVKGLFYGDASQFLAECIGVLANFVYIGIAAYIVFKVINAITPLRNTDEEQIMGLDIPEIGVEGYPEFSLIKSSHK
ncbi:MAG: ammonium transporter [Deltaproteobacteria bacterium]|nr:ammonium transporter [Deltaproteobacteria bacterium]